MGQNPGPHGDAGGEFGLIENLDEAGVDWEARESPKGRAPKEIAQAGIAAMREAGDFELLEEMRERIRLTDSFIQARIIKKELMEPAAPKTKKRL